MKLLETSEDKQIHKHSNRSGFTLVELLLVIGIMLILVVVSLPVYGNLQLTSQLHDSEDRLRQFFRLAQVRSISGLNDSAHGIYVEINPATEDRVILYQGDSYLTRDTSLDQPESFTEIVSLSTSLSGSDVNFARPFGLPSATGTVVISHRIQGISTTTITNLGTVLSQ